jgi:predicted deacylase
MSKHAYSLIRASLTGWPLPCLMVLAAMVMPAAAAGRSVQPVAPGTPWETSCYIQDSGHPGPVVLLVGGICGDEPAGAYAVDEIRHWPITRGKLIALPRANLAGLKAATRLVPRIAASLADLDRDFPALWCRRLACDSPAGETPAPQAGLAASIWQLVGDFRPDWVVDLHDPAGPRQSNPSAVKIVGNIIRIGRGPEAEAAGSAMRAAVNATVAEADERFVCSGRPVPGSLAYAAGNLLGARSVVVETNSGEEPLALRIRQHRIMVHALLARLGMIDQSVSVEWITDREPPRRQVRLAIYAGPGTRKGMRHLSWSMEKLKDAVVVPVGPEEIDAGVLSQFNVVLFPGGSGTRQGEALGGTNRQQLRQFIQGGGGYIGICAGAYLATTDFPWSLRIIDAKTYTKEWKRGRGVVAMEITGPGREILGREPGHDVVQVRYHNGPILVPAHCPGLDDFQTLAYFRGEVAEGDAPKGVMIDSPAIVAGSFGRGRVVCFSPHPDQTKGLEELVRGAVRWAAKPG